VLDRDLVPNNPYFDADDLEDVTVTPQRSEIRFRGLDLPIVYNPASRRLPWERQGLERAWAYFAPRVEADLDDDDAFAEFVEALEELVIAHGAAEPAR